MMPLRWLVLTVIAAAGCALPLSDLAPFPCAADQSCPGELACVPGVGCTAARLDALCFDTTDCRLAGDGVACRQGLCAPSCQAGQGCAAGRVCSSRDAAGTCLLGCAIGQDCPQGLVCKDLWYGGKRACMLETTTIPACTEFVSAATLRSCGLANFTTPCSDGSRCAADSYCAGNGQCFCNPGFALVSCGGQTCSGSCPSPNWWCVPQAELQSCLATSTWGPQVLHCADGRATPSTCATPDSCKERCEDQSAGCDTVTQNCQSAATPKCSLTADSSGNGATTCVAVLGQGAPGAVCQNLGTSGDGLDDCRVGAICTEFGSAAGARACRQFCRRDDQCGAGEHCLAVSDLSPADGVCLPDCQLFSGCPGSLVCTPFLSVELKVVGYCRALGTGTIGSACTEDPDCADAMRCQGTAGSAICTQLCNSTHACATGTTCTALPNTSLGNGAGICK